MSTEQADSDAREEQETPPVESEPVDTPPPLSEVIRALSARWCKDGIWQTVQPIRDQMMRECRKQGMSKEEARAWTYGELDRLYPPLPATERQEQEAGDSISPQEAVAQEPATSNVAHAREG